MQNYSPQELERMQKQAIDRVHEMQRQAKLGAAENRRSMSGAALHYTQPGAGTQQKTPKPQSPPQPQPGNEIPKAEHRPPPKEPNAKKPPTPPQPEKAPPEIRRVPGRKQAAPFLSMDSDTALILPLILLLQKDGADEMLILALLYIMA